jgi:hypothetical protein
MRPAEANIRYAFAYSIFDCPAAGEDNLLEIRYNVSGVRHICISRDEVP